jgi:hypothetical protein
MMVIGVAAGRAHAQSEPSQEEQAILAGGEVSVGRHVGGGLAGTFLGFAVGFHVPLLARAAGCVRARKQWSISS